MMGFLRVGYATEMRGRTAPTPTPHRLILHLRRKSDVMIIAPRETKYTVMLVTDQWWRIQILGNVVQIVLVASTTPTVGASVRVFRLPSVYNNNNFKNA